MLSPVISTPRVFVVKTKMAERVTGRVQRAQLNSRLAFERDHFVVFNKTIDMNVVQCFGCLRVCCDRNVASEMRFESIDATDVIRMQMRQDYLAHSAVLRRSFRQHTPPALAVRLRKAIRDRRSASLSSCEQDNSTCESRVAGSACAPESKCSLAEI